jgi:hypothetical protein
MDPTALDRSQFVKDERCRVGESSAALAYAAVLTGAVATDDKTASKKLRRSRGLQGRLALAVVLHVRDLAGTHRHELKEKRLTALTSVVDPVDAYDGCAGAHLNELVSSEAAIAGPERRHLLLACEDRPGLIWPLSAWRLAPPQVAAFGATPDRGRREEPCERVHVAFVRGLIRPFELLNVRRSHRSEYGIRAVVRELLANVRALSQRRQKATRWRRPVSAAVQTGSTRTAMCTRASLRRSFIGTVGAGR